MGVSSTQCKKISQHRPVITGAGGDSMYKVMYLKSPRGFIVMSHDRDERGVREKIRRTSPRGRRNTERKERDNREDEYTMWRVDEIEMMIVGVIEIIKERQERHTVEMGEKQGMGEGIDKGMGLFI
ncbi:unnamed protein product [Arabidopsis thaliana]|nr:unnamed protein product [Arabidopsis thaliana]